MKRQQPPPRNISYSSSHSAVLNDYAIPDIDSDEEFWEIFLKSRDHTMTGKDAMFALYQAVKYVVESGIEGDFVECGTWRGGSGLVAALTFRLAGESRSLHLFDTFEGMTMPEDIDIDKNGTAAKDYMGKYSDEGKWCYAGKNEVHRLFERNDFPDSQVNLVEGDVIKTLSEYPFKKISILRLDTDWYASTKHELEICYPLLSKGGVLIIDDYGSWEGSRKAVDEYFLTRRKPLLLRVNGQVRIAIKI